MVRALVLLFVLIPTLALAQVFPRGSRRILSVNNDPTGVALADFDRDGNLDLAVTERGLDRFSLYLGDGNGGFAPRVMYDTGDSPTQIAAGDVNADGLVDLAIANSSASTVTVYLGGPLGQMVNRIDYPVGSNPFGIAIGDADSDGRTDIVTANSGGFSPGSTGEVLSSTSTFDAASLSTEMAKVADTSAGTLQR